MPFSISGKIVEQSTDAQQPAPASGKIDAKKLITHKYNLENMDEGLKIMRDNTEFFAKIMVVND